MYRRDIDGLRAIAILAVILYHAGIPGFSGGYVGVDVFFVISGFLITGILQKELSESGTLSLRSFYAKRVRRLLPALLFMILGTLVFWQIFVTGLGDPGGVSRSLRWSLLGVANVFFMRNTGGYFDGPATEMPFLHLWSLAVEEQFYFIWPLLLLLSRRKSRLILTGVGLASLALAENYIRNGNASHAFYLMPTRAWELGVGSLLALGLGQFSVDWKPSKRIEPALRILGLGLIAYAVHFYSERTVFPGLAALYPVLGTALLIRPTKSSSPHDWILRVLSSPLFVRIGLLSYGWYLWHWPLFSIARVWNLGGEPSLILKLILIFGSLLLAEFSLRFVEAPIRSGTFFKNKKPFVVIATGLLMSVIFYGIASGFPRVEKSVLSAKYGSAFMTAFHEEPKFGKTCFDVSGVGTDRCNFSFSTGSSTDRVPVIGVWGDSHACSFFPLASDFAQKNHFDAVKYCQGNTLPLLFGRADENGSDLSSVVFRDLKSKMKSGHPVSLIISARWLMYSTKTTIAHTTLARGIRFEEMRERLGATLRELNRIGIHRIAVLLPYPEFRSPTLRCLQKTPNECFTSRAEIDVYRLETVTLIREVARDFKNVRVIDPVASVCTSTVCPQVLEGLPVVTDDNHATPAMVRKIATRETETLNWLIAP